MFPSFRSLVLRLSVSVTDLNARNAAMGSFVPAVSSWYLSWFTSSAIIDVSYLADLLLDRHVDAFPSDKLTQVDWCFDLNQEHDDSI